MNNYKVTTVLEVGVLPKSKIRQFINFDSVDSLDYPLLGNPKYTAMASQLTFSLRFGIELPFEVPAENCMAVELVEDGLHGVSGVVKYDQSFL